jgi:hyperosmotically inducible protein
MRTDEEIKRDLIDELYWDYRVDASHVKAEVSDGRVELTGTVSSYSARNAAVTAAWGIDGVREVDNEIAVRFPPTFETPTDAEIEVSARRTLAWNPDVHGSDIRVTVAGGILNLEGAVDAYWERWKAEDLVSGLRGVVDVENHLTVVPSESFVDQDIANNIEAALERNQFIDAEDVTVRVEGGEVTLTGIVPTYYARGKAYDAAAFTPGVLDVDNQIAVG